MWQCSSLLVICVALRAAATGNTHWKTVLPVWEVLAGVGSEKKKHFTVAWNVWEIEHKTFLKCINELISNIISLEILGSWNLI
jgi:flagellar motor component MotA